MIRRTAETGPTLPELLVFSPAEAEVSVRALSYYATTSLKTLEANWDVEGLRGITSSPKEAIEEVDRLATFLGLYKALAGKFSGVIDKPEQATFLSYKEIEAVGFSLFRLGNSGLTHAKQAISNGRVGFSDTVSRLKTEANIHETADRAYTLFKELEPIGRSKSIAWMVWQNRPSSTEKES